MKYLLAFCRKSGGRCAIWLCCICSSSKNRESTSAGRYNRRLCPTRRHLSLLASMNSLQRGTGKEIVFLNSTKQSLEYTSPVDLCRYCRQNIYLNLCLMIIERLGINKTSKNNNFTLREFITFINLLVFIQYMSK